MIEEIGIVSSTDGPTAVVNVPKKSTCDGCTAGTCTAGERSMEIVAENKAGAKPGQKVKVVVQSYVYLKGTAIIYGLPALALVMGAVLGKEVMSVFLPWIDADLVSAIFGFGFLALSFLGVKQWANRKSGKKESRPVIEEILD